VNLASREYANKNVDLEKLAGDIEEFFRNDGYKTQSGRAGSAFVVQARKEDVLRDLLGGDRAFTIILSGGPDSVKVSVGVGKWLQNLSVDLLEGIVFSPVVFLAEIPTSLWSYEIETELWRFVDSQVQLRTAAVPS
jgi:hypothetical protein